MGTGECGGMECIERLCRRIFLWVLVNGVVWAVSSGYGEGHMVGTGECSGMGCTERLISGTFGGHW